MNEKVNFINEDHKQLHDQLIRVGYIYEGIVLEGKHLYQMNYSSLRFNKKDFLDFLDFLSIDEKTYIVTHHGFDNDFNLKYKNFHGKSLKEVLGYYQTKNISKSQIIDNVNNPPHYTQFPMELKEWNFAVIETIQNKNWAAYFKTVSGYLHRAHLKNGLEDVKKAIFWLQDAVNKFEQNKMEIK